MGSLHLVCAFLGLLNFIFSWAAFVRCFASDIYFSLELTRSAKTPGLLLNQLSRGGGVGGGNGDGE